MNPKQIEAVSSARLYKLFDNIVLHNNENNCSALDRSFDGIQLMSKQTTPQNYPVFLFFEQGLERKCAEQTSVWVERFPGPITIQVIDPPVLVKPSADGLLNWLDTFNLLGKLREKKEIPHSAFVFLLTKTPIEHNWYAVSDPQQMRNSFGCVGDFSWVTTAPNSVIASHYIFLSVFKSLLDEVHIPWNEMGHQETRGCFFDFCSNKWDLSFKLRTADICGDCMQIFQSAKVPESLLKQTVAIMEASRRLAINTGQYLEQEANFNDWPFPVAITRHKVIQASNPLLRFMLLLDHFDSLVRYFYLAREVAAGRQPAQVERPSLGWWVDQLAISLKGEKHFREVIRIADQEKVVNLRNEKRGHAWMSLSEESYRKEADSLERVLARIEDELRPFFEKHRLLIPRHIQLTESKWVVDGENLLGSHLLHPPFRLEFTQDPRSFGLTSLNEVFLTDNKMQSFRQISPFIQSTTCPECQHPRILITDGGRRFIDIFVGHRVQL